MGKLTKLTAKLLAILIQDTWKDPELQGLSISVGYVLGAETVYTDEVTLTGEDGDGQTIYTWIFKNPKYWVTDLQLCTIIDEGNHCISKGAIVYETNLVYVIWSNHGHI
jgi:hypothetical protein